MSLASLQFLAALLLLSAIFLHLPGLQWRQGLLALCNIGFLYLLMPNAESWVALAAFIISGYAVGWLLARRPSSFLLASYLVALVAAFLILRKYDFVTAWLPSAIAAHAISIVGLSYILFRQIHFLVDASQGQIERMSLWTYAKYLLSFFTLISGPIQRYQDFAAQWDELAPVHEDRAGLQLAFCRLLIGFIKLAIIAAFFQSLQEKCFDVFTHANAVGEKLSAGTAIANFLGLFYYYPLYLYLNFSGYCDIVIAGATFVGMKLPENFDRPYLSRNVIDFWTRFHRTLGFWIRDYLFLPLYKAVAERWAQRADSLAFLCYFVAFFLAGVWHGPTWNFVVYGLLQAVGVSAAKLWERHIVKRRGRAGLKEYMQSPRIRPVAILATLHFECFSLLFFPYDIFATFRIFRTLLSALV